MNKKYMDFVPKKTAKTIEKKPVEMTPKTVPEVSRRVATPKKTAPAKVAPVKMATRGVLEKKAPKLPVRPAFVNTEKVRKRPLSKNVYPKKPVVPKEEKSTAPVTIIDKPEKDSKVGLIVTIIITIILGAAAGTVAFLLLPK